MTYTIAGKTGTAQVFTRGQEREYNEKTVHDRLRDHSLVHRFCAGRGSAHRVAVIVENGGFGSTRRRADRAQGDGRVPARCQRQAQAAVAAGHAAAHSSPRLSPEGGAAARSSPPTNIGTHAS